MFLILHMHISSFLYTTFANTAAVEVGRVITSIRPLRSELSIVGKVGECLVVGKLNSEGAASRDVEEDALRRWDPVAPSVTLEPHLFQCQVKQWIDWCIAVEVWILGVCSVLAVHSFGKSCNVRLRHAAEGESREDYRGSHSEIDINLGGRFRNDFEKLQIGGNLVKERLFGAKEWTCAPRSVEKENGRTRVRTKSKMESKSNCIETTNLIVDLGYQAIYGSSVDLMAKYEVLVYLNNQDMSKV